MCIEVWYHDLLIATFANITVGQSFFVNQNQFTNGRFGTEITIVIFEALAYRKKDSQDPVDTLSCRGSACVTMHTSCSHPIYVGVVCGWIEVAGFVNDLGADSTECRCADAVCDGPEGRCDGCTNGQHIGRLQLQFSGEDAATTKHYQPSSKVTVVGNSYGITTVDIMVSTTTQGIVALFDGKAIGEVFHIDAAYFASGSFPTEIILSIYDLSLIHI